MKLIILVIAVILLVGLKPVVVTIGFGAIGLALLGVALYLPHLDGRQIGVVEIKGDEIASNESYKSTANFIQRIRQRLFSIAA